LKSKKRFVDGRTDVLESGRTFETGFIRPTRRSRLEAAMQTTVSKDGQKKKKKKRFIQATRSVAREPISVTVLESARVELN